MLVEHAGRRPQVDPTAWVALNAVLSGAVTIGPGACVLHGAVLTAGGGAELVVGRECVIMEQAVLRAAGRFSLRLGEHVLVEPEGKTRAEIMDEMLTRYTRALRAHRDDHIIDSQ